MASGSPHVVIDWCARVLSRLATWARWFSSAHSVAISDIARE